MTPEEAELAESFVRAVARHGATSVRLIDASNTHAGTMTLTNALATGHAYVVRPHPGLLVLDEDLTGDANQDRQRTDAMNQLIASARATQLGHVVVDSGRPGNRHLYLVTGLTRSDRIQREVIAQWCRERGLDVRDRGIRPPMARHRYAWMPPARPRSGLPAALATLEASTSPGPARTTSRFCRELLGSGLSLELLAAVGTDDATQPGHYRSASEARMALALGLAAIGSSKEALRRLLAADWLPLSVAFRRKRSAHHEQQQELDRLWQKATLRVAQTKKTGPNQAVQDWADAVERQHWCGRAGGTDRAVAEAIGHAATRLRSTRVGYATADVAVAAGVSRNTARTSLRRLRAAGWLIITREATWKESTEYGLTIPAGAPLGEDVEPPRLHGSALDDLGGDHARPKALGKITTILGRRLAGRHATASTMAGWLRVTVATIRHHLRKLAAAGLAERNPATGEWTLTATPESVREHSAERKTLGSREHQQAMLEEERYQRSICLAGRRDRLSLPRRRIRL